MRKSRTLLQLCLFGFTVRAYAQESSGPGEVFDRKNTWTLLAEDSNTSSHFIAGEARQRAWATFGGAYTRRVARFWGTELGYRIELRPLVFESDPVYVVTETLTGAYMGTFTSTQATAGVCRPYTNNEVEGTSQGTVSITTVATCGRQWTFGQAFSPFGVRYALGYRHRVQPFVIGTLGYLYTSRPVPVADAAPLNFLIDVGAGLELFRAGRRSVSVEARAHHLSNRDTAQANPGIDAVVYGVAYSFGR